jgi:methyl-accepting chemotaxis protein
VIEFNMDGTIVTANQNFLDTMGYRLDEIAGKHHRMFVTPEQRDNPDYHAFWAKLNRGEYQAAEYKRVGKGGREVWIQASYNPILDSANKPTKVVKFATDITERKIRNMEDAGKIAAIARAQAVIEFNLDGTIITANNNFLSALGYSLAEIQGKHHQMFVAPASATAQPTASSGQNSAVASSSRPNTSVSARVARRSGFLRPTTRSSTTPASRSRW